MKCKGCGGTMVSRNAKDRPGGMYRRRLCNRCGAMVSTLEQIINPKRGRPRKPVAARFINLLGQA